MVVLPWRDRSRNETPSGELGTLVSVGGPVDVGDLVDGKYRLLRMIGEGGRGIVFEAENSRTLKHVALKVLRPQANLTPDILVRFEREAQAAGRITRSTSSKCSISAPSMPTRTTW